MCMCSIQHRFFKSKLRHSCVYKLGIHRFVFKTFLHMFVSKFRKYVVELDFFGNL